MGMELISIWQYTCDRCKHKWLARNTQLPAMCPRCKSKQWNARNDRVKQTISQSIQPQLETKPIETINNNQDTPFIEPERIIIDDFGS